MNLLAFSRTKTQDRDTTTEDNCRKLFNKSHFYSNILLLWYMFLCVISVVSNQNQSHAVASSGERETVQQWMCSELSLQTLTGGGITGGQEHESRHTQQRSDTEMGAVRIWRWSYLPLAHAKRTVWNETNIRWGEMHQKWQWTDVSAEQVT